MFIFHKSKDFAYILVMCLSKYHLNVIRADSSVSYLVNEFIVLAEISLVFKALNGCAISLKACGRNMNLGHL